MNILIQTQGALIITFMFAYALAADLNLKEGFKRRSKEQEQRVLAEPEQSVEHIKLMNDTNRSRTQAFENTNQVDVINDADDDDEEYYEDYGDEAENTLEMDGNDAFWSEYAPEANHERPVRSYRLSNFGDRVNEYIRRNWVNDEDYQSDQPTGALTNYKEQNLGNPASVQSNFDYLKAIEEDRQMKTLKEMANKNSIRIYSEVSCKVPKPRLIYPSDITKNYEPRAAYLHRCDDSTGCCKDPHMVCQETNHEIVLVAFWEHSLTGLRPKYLEFKNHTECGCRLPSQRSKRNSKPCQCPEYFTDFGTQRDHYHDEILQASTSCRCDCHLNNPTCQRLKNGEEGFPMSERKCIVSHKCAEPICNYGSYNRHKGRCPSPDSMRQNGRQEAHGHRGHG